MTTSQELESELKQLIVEALLLEDVTPAELDSHEPLFDEGLGLDSLDALELATAIRKRWGVETASEDEDTRRTLSTVPRLAAFIQDELAAAAERRSTG